MIEPTHAEFYAAYRAIEDAIEELDMDWTAHKSIQGERSTKVLAWRAAQAVREVQENVRLAKD